MWGPVEAEFDYVSMGGSNWVTSMPPLVARFLDRAEGEVLYVSKPKLFSYGLALPLKFTANRPVIQLLDHTGVRRLQVNDDSDLDDGVEG